MVLVAISQMTGDPCASLLVSVLQLNFSCKFVVCILDSVSLLICRLPFSVDVLDFCTFSFLLL